MKDPGDGEGWPVLSGRSRRRFIQTAGIVGLGLTAGASADASSADAQQDNGGDDTAAQATEDESEADADPDQFKLLAESGAANDNFGWSVSVDGETLLVGSPHDDDQGVAAGAAYVYTRGDGEWIQQAKLVAEDGTGEVAFGRAVSLHGDTALVGAGHDDELGFNAGAAYVFTRSDDSWTQQAKLLADDGEPNDVFGDAVSIEGDTALVGAYGNDNTADNAGAVYVFTRHGDAWTQHSKLTVPDGELGDFFGYSVSLDGDTALVGAIQSGRTGIKAGAAHVFTRRDDTWSQAATLVADDAHVSDFFGFSTSLSGDTALVGAYLNDENGAYSGAAYVFTRKGGRWCQQEKLLADDQQPGDAFGYAVGLHDDTALVTARDHDARGEQAGAAYLFTRREESWRQGAKLLADDGDALDFFGYSADFDGDTALVGATREDENGDDAGAAYAFDAAAALAAPDPDDETEVSPTEIDSCTVIDEPGEYELVSDLAPETLDQPACIVIDADGVTLDGNGHTIDLGGVSAGDVDGVSINPGERHSAERDHWQTAVRDLVVRGGRYGVSAWVSGFTLFDRVTAVENFTGFYLFAVDATVTECVAADNDRQGFDVTGDPPGVGGSSLAMADSTVQANGLGVSVDNDSAATVATSRLVANRVGIQTFEHSSARLEDCHICGNERFGAQSIGTPGDDSEGIAPSESIIRATNCYWGASNGPSSFGDPEDPYTDPETGRPADGDGDAVSESLDPGVSNVRFDPFHRSTIDDTGDGAGAGR